MSTKRTPKHAAPIGKGAPPKVSLRGLSVIMSGRKYKDVSDPLHSWGTLRRDINTLKAPKLRALLARELRAPTPRGVILRALTGRINALARGDGTRGPRAYHAQIGASLGLPSRKVKKLSTEVAALNALPKVKRARAKA